MPESVRRQRPWVTAVLVVALVALFVVPMFFANAADPEGEKFGGTDSKATEVIQEAHPGYKPWFEPLFEPGSGEVESGLFALQAAAGALVVGYVAGRLHARHLARRDEEPSPTADRDPADAEA